MLPKNRSAGIGSCIGLGSAAIDCGFTRERQNVEARKAPTSRDICWSAHLHYECQAEHFPIRSGYLNIQTMRIDYGRSAYVLI